MALIERRDAMVTRVREGLRRLVQISGRTQRAIEQQNGFTRGYLSQVLQGHIELSARHVFGILFALEVQPEDFFRDLFSNALGWSAALPADEIRERMARYDAALRQLEEKGLLDRLESPHSEAGGGVDRPPQDKAR